MRTIADLYQGRNNNFTLLRFLSATFVILCHSWDLLRKPDLLDPYIIPLKVADNLGVLCFFVISGFLVTESYVKKQDSLAFINARVLRIVPGLFISVVLTALCLGPFITTLPLSEYFTSGQTYSYIYSNSLVQHMNIYLPGTFANNPFPLAVNGSLWTLPLEFKLYLLLFLVGSFGLLRRQITAVITVLACFIAYACFQHTHNYLVHPILAFLIGSLFYLLREKVVLDYRVLLGLMMLWIALPSSYLTPVSLFILAYVTMLIAFSRVKFTFMDKYGDFSYGLYIYAFPIQQALIYYFPPITPAQLFSSAMAITLICAILSWYFVEKPALQFKDKLNNFTALFFKKIEKIVYIFNLKSLNN